MADGVVEYSVTIHRSELIPGGMGARVGVSDDHPGRVFVVIPGEHPDYGTPHCPCGCAMNWSDNHHRWRCPHCDGSEQMPQQTIAKGPT